MSYLPKPIGELIRRLAMVFRRRQLDLDLEEEMRLHLDLRCQQQIESGLSPTAASQAANRKFGNETHLKEKSIMTWGSEGLESFFHDAAYGARALLRNPALTLVALLSLALGIGANTAIFSLLDAVLLRSLPVKDPQQLVLLGTGDWNGITDNFAQTEAYSYPFYRQLQQKNAVFSSTAAIFSMLNEVHGFVLTPSGESRTESQPLNVQLVSGAYFLTLGVEAQRGRIF